MLVLFSWLRRQCHNVGSNTFLLLWIYIVSTDRQEPQISLSIDEEDIAHRAAGARPVAPASESRGGGAATFLLTLICICLGAAAYYLYDQLLVTQAQLEQSDKRIDILAERLSLTDESFSERDDSVQHKLKEYDSEIRKLWDNVWKKQKAELAKQSLAVTKATKRLAVLESKQKAGDGKLASAMKGYEADREQLKSMAGKLDRTIAQAEVNRTQLIDVAKRLRSGGSLDNRLRSVEKQIVKNDEWLDSVNAFRRQVNRDLEAMRQTVSRYHAGSPPQ